ncbi:hypothetical protein M9H77_17077 [Catharanthus roseus]|uniref:Uncharacterized protein n=1 Tax=Catharanthus roseus TaxID=4058 RepID=A0ACC0B3M1_CATRO|nr:hypothetical protein M9H77_17077 [Catharanthus roseus]
MVVSMLLLQGAIDHSIALGQPSSTNLHILMNNFIHLLTVVEEEVLEEEACLDTLKKQVATTKPPTSNFKPWPKKEEASRGHYASSCPTKRALIFREDLNGWIEEEDESGECVEGEENGDDNTC